VKDPARVALVVVDMQNDFCHPEGVFARAGLRIPHRSDLVARVNQLVLAARAAGQVVVWVRTEWTDEASVGLLAERSPFLADEGLRAGTWGSELVGALDPEPTDHHIVKTRFDAFLRTPLADLLEELGVGTLVVTGVRTDFCVESTVREAFFRDYRVAVAREAVAGYVDELHENSLRVMGTVFADIVDNRAAIAVLERGGR
jgi:ureidoacrylate peracid hydrolase